MGLGAGASDSGFGVGFEGAGFTWCRVLGLGSGASDSGFGGCGV